MKRHVAVLTAGALALTVGLAITLETVGSAEARTVHSAGPARQNFQKPTFQRQNFQKPAFQKQNFQKQNFQKQNFQKQNFTKQKFNNPNLAKQKFNNPNLVKQKFNNPNLVKQKFNNPNLVKQKFNNPNLVKQKLNTPQGIAFGPKGPKGPQGPGIVLGPKGPKGPNVNVGGLRVGGPYINIVRGPRRIWWNGSIRTLVALGVLGGIYVGGTYFIADGYVPLGAPACRGLTPDGCQLTWRDVPTEDGSLIAQCVQFCPRRVATAVDAPVVAQPAATPGPAAMAQGCEISIHAEPNFGGVNSDVTADQPQLAQFGWDRAISSINIKSGTWDFYSDDNYGGQMIRLGPGQYATLAQGWDKTINSLMCAQP